VGVTLGFAVTPSSARLPTRSSDALLSTALVIAPASARVPERATQIGIALFEPGMVTGVAAEMRTVPVFRD